MTRRNKRPSSSLPNVVVVVLRYPAWLHISCCIGGALNFGALPRSLFRGFPVHDRFADSGSTYKPDHVSKPKYHEKKKSGFSFMKGVPGSVTQGLARVVCLFCSSEQTFLRFLDVSCK